jgi:hypothetical protein
LKKQKQLKIKFPRHFSDVGVIIDAVSREEATSVAGAGLYSRPEKLSWWLFCFALLASSEWGGTSIGTHQPVHSRRHMDDNRRFVMSAIQKQSVSGGYVERVLQNYPLSIDSLVEIDAQGRKLRSPTTSVLAEAGLDQYSESGFPVVFAGRLVDVPFEQILDFKFLPEVEVGFKGARYKFEEIEKDGTFKLRRQ